MIDIEDDIYETLVALPNVDHVSIDSDENSIFLLVRTKDDQKEAIVIQREELIKSALSGIKFNTVDKRQTKLI